MEYDAVSGSQETTGFPSESFHSFQMDNRAAKGNFEAV